MIVSSQPPLLVASAPGTTGLWVGKIVRRFGVHVQSLGTPHEPAWRIDEEESFAPLRDPQLLRIGVVCDPWRWYAVTWMEAMRSGGAARDAVSVWGRGSTTFREFLYGATHPEKVTESMPNPPEVTWAGGSMSSLLASTLGLCSYTFLYHYGLKSSWLLPGERPAFAVDVLADGNDPEGLARCLLGLDPAATLPARPGPPKASIDAMRIGFDSGMTRWVAEADRPLLTAMRYGPFTKAGAGLLFPVRKPGAVRRESVTPLPTSEVEKLDRGLVEQMRAMNARKGSLPDGPLVGAPARLRRWIERPA